MSRSDQPKREGIPSLLVSRPKYIKKSKEVHQCGLLAYYILSAIILLR